MIINYFFVILKNCNILGQRGAPQQAASAARTGSEMAAAPGSAATRHTD